MYHSGVNEKDTISIGRSAECELNLDHDSVSRRHATVRVTEIHEIQVEGQDVLTTQIYFSGGDIPDEGALDETGTELDTLLVEVLAGEDGEGDPALTAEHMLVLP